MTGLVLPALDGRTPLAFLAGLGVLRLVTENGHPEAKLSWSERDCAAVLHDAQSTIDELVADLTAVVEAIPGDGVLPGLPPDVPPPGAAPDKLRLPRPEYRAYVEKVREETGRNPDAERWITSLVTDLGLDDQDRAAISLFTAPSGKQSMRTMLEKPLAFVRRNPGVLREALVAWRRYPGVTGEYLDHLVLFDAADAPDGKPSERGVPGATWLALMSYPLFLTTAVNGDALTTGWQRRGRSRRFVYPLWSEPVDVHGAVALMSHPMLRDAAPGVPPEPAKAASVFLVGAAGRQQLEGRTFAGVLTPERPAPPVEKRPPRNHRRGLGEARPGTSGPFIT